MKNSWLEDYWQDGRGKPPPLGAPRVASACRYACAAFPHCGCEVESLNPPAPRNRRFFWLLTIAEGAALGALIGLIWVLL